METRTIVAYALILLVAAFLFVVVWRTTAWNRAYARARRHHRAKRSARNSLGLGPDAMGKTGPDEPGPNADRPPDA